MAPGKDSDIADKPSDILGKIFFCLERLACFHSIPVILVSLVLAGLSIWITINYLKFNTSRGDLIAKDLPYTKLYKEYRDQFEDFDGMIVVVEAIRVLSITRSGRSGRRTASSNYLMKILRRYQNA